MSSKPDAGAKEQSPVTVVILDKEYRVACPSEEREGLVASARYLDEKMREIRSRGRTVGNDNLAVMAALNIAHEMLQDKTRSDLTDQGVSNRIKSIQAKVEDALSDTRQIEI